MKLIAGSGRSGTTWVQDALAGANRLPTVFEPLHPAVSALGREYAYRALTRDDVHPELQRFFEAACRGKVRPMWTRYRGRPDLLLPPLSVIAEPGAARKLYHEWRYFLGDLPKLSRRDAVGEPLVKCIRANLMLGWLKRFFECRIVLIIRHPGAVIESQVRLSQSIWDPGPILARYRADARLNEISQGRYRQLLSRKLSRTEALALNWVIENQIALETAESIGVTVVQYEKLKTSPDVEWPRLCQALDLASVPNRSIRERPSQQSAVGRPQGSSSAFEAPRWYRSLTQDQKGQVQGILDETRFHLYSMEKVDLKETTAKSKSVTSVLCQ